MKRIFCSFLSLVLCSLAVGGCSSHQKLQPRHALRLNLGAEPQSLDPRLARDTSSLAVSKMLFDGLTRVNKEGIAELALAQSVEVSEDLTRYCFILKEAYWSNAEPITAHDFVYTWGKTLDPAFPSDTAFHLYVLKNGKDVKEGKAGNLQLGVRAIDEKRLEIQLEHPTPYFLELLASPPFFAVSQKVDEQNPDWARGNADFVGNGPFQLREWKHENFIALEKNEKYWDVQSVKIPSIYFAMVSSETAFQMFEKKQIDWMGSPLSDLPFPALDSLKAENRLEIQEMLGTSFVRINVAKPPFHHPLMRKAFALAVNRQALVDHVLSGGQTAATGLVPLSLGLQQDPYFQDGNVEEARRLFAEALSLFKMEKKDLPEISFLFYASERNRLVSQALQEQWYEAFGIRVHLEPIEGKLYFDRIAKMDYQLANSSWIADFADPINFLEVFMYKTSGSNNTSWENPKYTRFLQRSNREGNPMARKELLRKSEKILMNEMPIIPIFYFSMVYLKNDHLKDVVLTPMGNIDFKWAECSRK